MPKPTPEEIVRAHDVLCPVVSGEFPEIVMGDKTRAALHAAHDALAWILGFPCGEQCVVSIQRVEAAMLAHGYQLNDSTVCPMKEGVNPDAKA